MCSSIVVNHLQKKFKGVEDVAVACVYFNYKEARSPTDIIGNLVKQILERNSNISEEARALHSAHAQRESPPTLKELFQLFRTEAGRISTVFIVLDALDEFGDTDNARATVLLGLRQIPNTRMMITGRSHVRNLIQSKLDDVSTLLIRASNEDIRKYLNTQIEESLYLCEMVTTDQSLRATVLDTIVKKADGMFLTLQVQI
jgi:Cdc6-like AAA superfamily ATPase